MQKQGRATDMFKGQGGNKYSGYKHHIHVPWTGRNIHSPLAVSRQESASCILWAKSGPWLAVINKVLLKHKFSQWSMYF